MERKLLSFPPLLKLVVGPFGECSQDLHELLETMAEMKTQYQSRSRGEMESEWKIASNLSYLRRQLSVCAVRAVADSLLTRLQQAGLGPGGGVRRSEGGLDQPLLIRTATTAAALLDTPWRQWIKVELPLSSEVCTKDTTFGNSPRRLLFSSSVMGMKRCRIDADRQGFAMSRVTTWEICQS